MWPRRPGGLTEPDPAPGHGGPAGGADPAHPRADPGAAAGAPLDGAAVPRIAPRCAWQVVEGEAVLLDLHGRRIMGLNAAGSLAFGLVDGKRSVGELAAAVAARFGIARERALADLAAFLGALRARGLLEEELPAGSTAETAT